MTLAAYIQLSAAAVETNLTHECESQRHARALTAAYRRTRIASADSTALDAARSAMCIASDALDLARAELLREQPELAPIVRYVDIIAGCRFQALREAAQRGMVRVYNDSRYPDGAHVRADRLMLGERDEVAAAQIERIGSLGYQRMVTDLRSTAGAGAV